jgi:dTDP-4-dehydrorhamnose 3,5-epimerase
MKFQKLKIPGPVLIKPEIHKDLRGHFFERYKKKELDLFLGNKINFIQENQSLSKKNVFRGFHFQINPFSQSKLISVYKGKILDVIVDIRSNSKYFGKFLKIYLDSENNNSLFIPKGFAHGFFALSEGTVVNYKVDNYYSKIHEKCLLLTDKKLRLNLTLSTKKKIISKKDKLGMSLNEIFENKFF